MLRNRKLSGMAAVALLVLLTLLTACGSATDVPATTAAAGATTTTAATGATTAATTAASSGTGATTAATSTTTGAVTTVAGATTAASTAGCTKLNLNTLTEQQLTAAIPNFPNRMVREFLEYRPYASIAQFRKEIGKYVDAAQVTEWEKYVFVPIDPNKADAETLKQLPGVDNTIATALITGRPYASNATFLQTLTGKVSAQQAASAGCYLAGA